MRSRVAYKDYLGEVTEAKTTKILENVVLAENQLMLPVADAAFSGFVSGEAYRVILNGEEKSVVAKDFNKGVILSNVEDSENLPKDGWVLMYDSDASKIMANTIGAFLGATISVYYDETVTEQRWSVKKLAYELLPDQLLSDLEEMMEKLSSQIKSLQVDPVFSGSFSQNRKPEGIIGDNSHAEGSNTTAGGFGSHAEGSNTTAGGDKSHAEGSSTTASGANSHAEGNSTTASGNHSHAEGLMTVASVSAQHVEGMYNIDDGANSDKLHIVGNGTSLKRSNAHTLDKFGNAWYAGAVYVGSTSGTNRDEGSKKLATEAYVDDTKLIVASSSGKKYKITVDDTGTLSATEVTDTTT